MVHGMKKRIRLAPRMQIHKTLAVAAVVLLILAGACFCYYFFFLRARREPFANANEDKGVKVAIVSMMHSCYDIDHWLDWHVDRGVSRFYIRVEGDDEALLDTLQSRPRDLVLLRHGSANDRAPEKYWEERSGAAQMSRQRAWMDDAIDFAVKDDIDWLIHIDADELVDCEGARIQDHIRRAEEAKSDKDGKKRPRRLAYAIRNKEARYHRVPDGLDAAKTCFQRRSEMSFVDCRKHPRHCASYINGKPIGCVSVPGLRESGVHRFRHAKDPGVEKNATYLDGLSVLHFESCSFREYVKKFRELAKAEEDTHDEDAKRKIIVTPDPVEKITQLNTRVRHAFPFAFYNESLRVASSKVCGESGQWDKCESALRDVFARHRTKARDAKLPDGGESLYG